MHRVEMPPLSTPNEPVPLEDLHDAERDAVSVATVLGPKPIVCELGVYVDCRAPCMRTAVSCVLDGTAIECAGTRKRIFADLWRKLTELIGYRAELVRNA